VDTNLTIIQFEFDQDMSAVYSFPDCSDMVPIIGDPVWKTPRILEVPVKLKPESFYQLYLNSSDFRGFRSADGIPMNPDYFLIHTKNYNDTIIVDTSLNRINYENFCDYFLKHYSYKEIKGINWESELSSIKEEIKLSKSNNEFGFKLLKILKKADDVHLSMDINNRTFGCGLLRLVPVSFNFDDILTPLTDIQLSENNVVLTGKTGNTGYILITSLNTWCAQDILFGIEKIKLMKDLPFLILDLRLNRGGNEQLAANFVSMILSDTITYEKVARYNESTGQFDNVTEKSVIPDNASIRYKGEIFVLTGGNIVSSAESFVLMMRQMPNAQLIGGKTYGSSGNPQPFNITDSINVNIPSWLAYDMNNILIEGNGIEPDVELTYLEEVFASSDPIFNYVLDTIAHLPFVSVSSKVLRFGKSISNSISFEITSNINWTVSCDQPWIAIMSAHDSGSAAITLTATENFSSFQRAATLVVAGNGVSDKIINVTQIGAAAVLAVSKKNLIIEASANSTDTFYIVSNTTWEVKSNQPWLTVNKTSGSDSAMIIASASENSTGNQRSATITVTGNRISTEYILINQAASVASSKDEISSSDKIGVYPNPTTGLIEVSGINPFESENRIEVYNYLGSLVLLMNSGELPTVRIDLTDYPSGLYLINILSGNKSQQVKVLKNSD
jgi:hypothetical protein